MSVYQKIAEARGKIRNINPSQMEFGRTKYNYLSEAELTTKAKEVMEEVGLIILPFEVSQKNVIQVTGEKSSFLTDVTVSYRVYDINDDSDATVTVGAHGMDVGDKGMAKAMTAAYKTAIRQLFMIPSPGREDPDTTASELLRTATSYDSLGDYVFPGGKLAGKKLSEIWAKKNPDDIGYLKWLANNGKNQEQKNILIKFLEEAS